MAAEMTASTGAELRSSSLGRASVRALIASWLGWMFDGYETYALVLVMGSAVHQFLPPERLPRASVYIGGLLAATMLGWAGGGIAAGILADYFGRRRTLMLSILCYAVFSGLAAISWDYWSLLAFRFLVGLGLGAEWGPGAAIVAEQWAPASRGKAGGVLHAAYGVGLLLASGIWLFVSRLGQSSWRYMFLVGILPALLLLYVRRWVDEPAVWTETSRNRREAQQRVQMGKGSSHDKQLVRFTVSEILSDLELRRRIGILLLMSVTGFLTLGFFADTVGRKPTIWFYYLGALVVTVCYFLFARERTALLVMAGVNGFFSSGQFAWMTIYLPELFPTRVRGTAMSLVFDTSRSIAGLGPLLAGWLVTLFGGIGNAAAVMSLIYIVGLIATPFAGAETRGKPLPA